MVHQSLISYIRAQMGSGASMPAIKEALLRTGWIEKDINDAFLEIQQTAKPALPTAVHIQKPIREKTKPKITFSGSRVGVIVMMILFSLTVGAIFVVYYQNQHQTQTASTVSLPADIR